MKRLFVRCLLVFVHLLTAWVTISSLLWMYKLGLDEMDTGVAIVAMGVPATLIAAMFKVCQQYLREYSNSGVHLEGKSNGPKTEVQLSGKIVEVTEDGTQN